MALYNNGITSIELTIQNQFTDPLSECHSTHVLHMYSQYKGEMHDIFGLQKKTLYRIVSIILSFHHLT